MREKLASWESFARRAVGLAAVLAASAVLLESSTRVGAQVTGFGGSTETGWTPNTSGTSAANSVPNVAGTGTASDVLTLTSANNGEGASYWYNTPQNIGNFSETFTYQDVSKNGADGFAAVWQNAGTTALGGGGGQIGYSGISSAAGLVVNIYSGSGGSSSQYNGTVPSGSNPTVSPTNSVIVDLGNPINVSLNYIEANQALTETMTDTVTNATFTRVWRGISIQNQVGGSSAYVGFTGATGGVNAAQTVTNFKFASGAAAATPVATIKPIAATGWDQNMIVSATSGNNLTASMDSGSSSPSSATFYEQGLNTTNPTTGLPKAGTIFGSVTDSNHTFSLMPNGPGQNDAVLLDVAHPTGSLTLGGSTAYSLLSFLVAGGQGGGTISATISYADGTTQNAAIPSPDWYGNAPVAWYANGRIYANGSTYSYDTINGTNPRLYQEDLTLTDTGSPVTGISFGTSSTGTSNSRQVIYGLSGTAAVPEPTAMAVLAIGALLGNSRRRRSPGCTG